MRNSTATGSTVVDLKYIPTVIGYMVATIMSKLIYVLKFVYINRGGGQRPERKR